MAENLRTKPATPSQTPNSSTLFRLLPDENLELRSRKTIGWFEHLRTGTMTRNMTRGRLLRRVACAISAMLLCTAAIFSAAYLLAG